jgi:ABC-type transport system substrate-binding protein
MKFKLLYIFIFSCTLQIYCTNAHAKSLSVYTKYNIPAKSFSVLSSGSEASYVLSSGTYESLLNISVDGSLRPSLAKKWERVEKGFIFSLRNDVLFHSGRKFSSNDVSKSYKSIIAADKFSKLMLSSIKDIKILAKNKVLIITEDKSKDFLIKLAMWLRIYDCSDACASGSYNVAGTGRWIPEEKNEKYILLRKNKNYYGENVKYSNIKIYSKVVKSLEEYKTKDSIIIDRPKFSELTIKKQKKMNFQNIKLNVSNFGIFNLMKKNSIFQDKEVRKILNFSIDRDKLIKLVFKGKGELLSSLSMPTEKGSKLGLKRYPYTLLNKNDNSNKNKKFYIGLQTKDVFTKNFAKFLIKSASLVGLQGEVVGEYFVSEHDRFQSIVDIVLGSDPSPYGHFDFFVRNFFEISSPYAMNNNLKIKKILTQIKNTEDDLNRTKLYQEIDRYAHNEYLGVPGVQYYAKIAYSDDIAFLPYISGLLNLGVLK